MWECASQVNVSFWILRHFYWRKKNHFWSSHTFSNNVQKYASQTMKCESGIQHPALVGLLMWLSCFRGSECHWFFCNCLSTKQMELKCACL